MPQSHMITRTEKLRQLKAMLEESPIIYLSSFFYSGKTTLLDQLAGDLSRPVLRFDCESGDWPAFAAAARSTPDAALLIDNLDALSEDGAAEALVGLLSRLPAGACAVLAGRARAPKGLRRLCVEGRVEILDKDFMMFDRDEIQQLFLTYGVALTPSQIDHVKQRYWGYVLALHNVAGRMAKASDVPLRSLWTQVSRDLERLIISDVLLALPEPERMLLYNLAPFERFTAELARMVTGRTDAPKVIEEIAGKSYLLNIDGPDCFAFPPIVHRALFGEMKNLYTQDYIDAQYRRAALYHELQNQIPQAISWYARLGDREKVRELLIRDTHNRPADGNYAALRDAYAMLSRETLLASPELMKGMAMIESLLLRPEESERWVRALEQFLRDTPRRDGRRRVAEEAAAQLAISLPHRGSRDTLRALVSAARLKALIQTPSWRGGFSISGNSVTLLNGGKDFCRWVPHGWRIYRLMKAPVELALGRSGLGDIAIGECELESNLSGSYETALAHLCAGLSRVADDTELRCAAVGLQSRVVAAQGNAAEAIGMMDRLIASLPGDAPVMLRRNMAVHRLSLQLLTGDLQEAEAWLSGEAPDETGDFNVLDRYGYMLKLRLYIVLGRKQDVPLLMAKLRHYTETYDRPYLRIQLSLLQAMLAQREGDEGWREALTGALALAKRYRLARVIADEGIGVVDMLAKLSLPDAPWERGVLRLTRAQAAHYPSYMKPIASRPVLTEREGQVYALLAAGYRNAKIASVLNISERTVKFYTASIYKKLGVTSRSEALNRASELGDTL